jgi:hypothetical protein
MGGRISTGNKNYLNNFQYFILGCIVNLNQKIAIITIECSHTITKIYAT